MYVSKQYVTEKFENAKWDIEAMLRQTPDDKIPEDALERYAASILDNLKALEKEIGKAV